MAAVICWRRVAASAGAAVAALLLAGCSQSPNTVTIDYVVDGTSESYSFAPGDISCRAESLGGAFGLGLSKEPFTEISVSEGDPGGIRVGVFDESSVLFFESDEARVEATRFEDGSVVFSVTADSESVARVDLEGVAPGEAVDLTGVPRYSGSIDASIRCVPDDAT